MDCDLEKKSQQFKVQQISAVVIVLLNTDHAFFSLKESLLVYKHNLERSTSVRKLDVLTKKRVLPYWGSFRGLVLYFAFWRDS